MEKQEEKKEIKSRLSTFDKIFIAELVQDIPLWLALVMGIYPSLKSEILFFTSLITGIVASLFIIIKIKDGEYSPGIIAENPSDTFAFSIYSIALIVVLLIASWKEVLFMGDYVWTYIIVSSLLELIFFIKQKNAEK